MFSEMSKPTFMVAALIGGLALFVAGFVIALEVRSTVATPSEAPAAQLPNPGHGYDQIELPAGTWPGLDADTVDGLTGAQVIAGTKGFAFAPLFAEQWFLWDCESTTEIVAVPFVKVAGLDTLAVQFHADKAGGHCTPTVLLAVSQCGELETPPVNIPGDWTLYALSLDVSSIPDGSECVAVLRAISGVGVGGNNASLDIGDWIFEHR